MALPSSGQIKLSDVNVELGNSATAQISMNSSAVRGLYGVSSGQIRLAADGYGKSNAYAFSITANQTNASLYSLAVAAGWDESMAIEATINSGVTIYSTSTATPALTVSGFPSGVTLINNGTIVGKGGTGGNGGAGYDYNAQAGSAGTAGGTGLSVSNAMSIDNTNGIIAGGSGGGGGGAGRNLRNNADSNNSAGGGGGGGGINLSTGGGGGGGPGNQRSAQSGQTATLSAAGGGGQGGWNISFDGGYYSVIGGSGGSGGTYGATGNTGGDGGGYYGGYKAGGAGGSGGNCTSGNSNITWIANGLRYGTLA